MKQHIEALLQFMETESDKLDLLTCIGLGTKNDELFWLTEEIRGEIVGAPETSGEELLY